MADPDPIDLGGLCRGEYAFFDGEWFSLDGNFSIEEIQRMLAFALKMGTDHGPETD